MSEDLKLQLIARLSFLIRCVIGQRKGAMTQGQRSRLMSSMRTLYGITGTASGRRRQRLRVLIDEIRNKPCMDCGRTFPVKNMEFDHVPERGIKLGTLSKLNSTKKVLAEAEKCDVVCCACHEKRERARGGNHSCGVRPCPNAELPGGCWEHTTEEDFSFFVRIKKPGSKRWSFWAGGGYTGHEPLNTFLYENALELSWKLATESVIELSMLHPGWTFKALRMRRVRGVV